MVSLYLFHIRKWALLMQNCLICEHSAYDPVVDKYYCWASLSYIDILLDSSECSAYKNREEAE